MRPLVLILFAGLALSACGEAPRPATQPRVKLKLTVPGDGGAVRRDQVEVHGTVTPADAAVQVAGADAQVEAGAFSATVTLRPGGNVIDVTASSPGRRPAADAVRVVRDMRVEVPSLEGREVGDAQAALEALGLSAAERSGDDWLDRLIPGDVYVCETTPRAGVLVQPHSSVTLDTARDC